MLKNLVILGLSVLFLGALAPSAMAESIPTMNQPDNGFYEGPNPEWAILHSTDMHGTAAHRQYHRDAVQTHIQWHQEHQTGQGTVAYDTEHRLYHQEMNMEHRHFHFEPTNP